MRTAAAMRARTINSVRFFGGNTDRSYVALGRLRLAEDSRCVVWVHFGMLAWSSAASQGRRACHATMQGVSRRERLM